MTCIFTARVLSENLGCPAALSHRGLIDAPSAAQTHTELASAVLHLLDVTFQLQSLHFYEIWMHVQFLLRFTFLRATDGAWNVPPLCVYACVHWICTNVDEKGKPALFFVAFWNTLGCRCPDPQIAARCTSVQIAAGAGVALLVLNPSAASQYSHSPGIEDYFFLWLVLVL